VQDKLPDCSANGISSKTINHHNAHCNEKIQWLLSEGTQATQNAQAAGIATAAQADHLQHKPQHSSRPATAFMKKGRKSREHDAAAFRAEASAAS